MPAMRHEESQCKTAGAFVADPTPTHGMKTAEASPAASILPSTNKALYSKPVSPQLTSQPNSNSWEAAFADNWFRADST